MWLRNVVPDSGGFSMSPRRRSADKSIPISVALPLSIVHRLDMVLSLNQSRSKYIAKAIKNRLNEREETVLSNFSIVAIMCYLRDQNISNTLSKSLQQEIDFLLKKKEL
tara:strand:+ start:491 stop:817 length:327 start_codon:yes stop_codon:yes gene_type:complete